MKSIHVTAELFPEDEGGYSVYCPELDIYTQGETEEECLANLREAAELRREDTDGNVTTFPVPIHAGKTLKKGP